MHVPRAHEATTHAMCPPITIHESGTPQQFLDARGVTDLVVTSVLQYGT
jgi:hypothetical protein